MNCSLNGKGHLQSDHAFYKGEFCDGKFEGSGKQCWLSCRGVTSVYSREGLGVRAIYVACIVHHGRTSPGVTHRTDTNHVQM